jgi:hypothetical protein
MLSAPSKAPYFSPQYDIFSVTFWYWTKCKNYEAHRNEFVSFTFLALSPYRHNTHSLGQKHLYCTAFLTHLRELQKPHETSACYCLRLRWEMRIWDKIPWRCQTWDSEKKMTPQITLLSSLSCSGGICERNITNNTRTYDAKNRFTYPHGCVYACARARVHTYMHIYTVLQIKRRDQQSPLHAHDERKSSAMVGKMFEVIH